MSRPRSYAVKGVGTRFDRARNQWRHASLAAEGSDVSSQFRVAPTAVGAVSDAQPSIGPIDAASGEPSPGLGVECLYRRHHGRLLRFFSRQTAEPDALDLVHDTFARYADRAGGDVENPDAYLSQVAVKLLRDRAKFAVCRSAAYHQVFDDEQVVGDDPVSRLEARDMLRRLTARHFGNPVEGGENQFGHSAALSQRVGMSAFSPGLAAPFRPLLGR